MHNMLRAFVTATILVEQADEDQIDQRGAKKALGTVWAQLSSLHANVIGVAQELFDDPRLANAEPHELESQWLRAVIDEVGTPSTAPALNEDDSWAWLARSTAWLAFCLAQTESYARDGTYGQRGFEQIYAMLAQADDFEKLSAFAAITAAGAHLESTGSAMAQQVSATYGRLIRAVES